MPSPGLRDSLADTLRDVDSQNEQTSSGKNPINLSNEAQMTNLTIHKQNKKFLLAISAGEVSRGLRDSLGGGGGSH